MRTQRRIEAATISTTADAVDAIDNTRRISAQYIQRVDTLMRNAMCRKPRSNKAATTPSPRMRTRAMASTRTTMLSIIVNLGILPVQSTLLPDIIPRRLALYHHGKRVLPTKTLRGSVTAHLGLVNSPSCGIFTIQNTSPLISVKRPQMWYDFRKPMSSTRVFGQFPP